jgi:hypothetical protein
VLVPASGAFGAAQCCVSNIFGADGLTLCGVHLILPVESMVPTPVEVPLRMKNFTGLTGGSILFVV